MPRSFELGDRPRVGGAIVRLAVRRRPTRPERVDRRFVRHETEGLEVSEEGRLVLGPAPLPIVILDPQDHLPARCPRNLPDHERVRDVPEMEISRRGGGEPRPETRRKVTDNTRERFIEA